MVVAVVMPHAAAMVYSKKEVQVNLSWRHIHLRVPSKAGRGQKAVLKDVLRDVSGELSVGAVTAIMVSDTDRPTEPRWIGLLQA